MGIVEFMSVNSTIRSVQQTVKLRNAIQIAKPIWCPTSQGTIPAWLQGGVLYRVGPGRFNLGDDGQQYVIQHAFDGLTFVHRFEISAEKQSIRYNSRFVAEGAERALIEDPGKNQIFFGHVSKVSPWRAFTNLLERIDKMVLRPQRESFENPSDRNVGVTVTPNFPIPQGATGNDQILVTKTDANALQQVHADSLEPQRLFNYTDYDERFKGPLSAAHHQYDPTTKETINFTTSLGRTPTMTVFSLDKTGKNPQVLGQITERKLPDGTTQPFTPTYIHAFWATKNYVIVPESPLHYGKNGLDITLQGNLAAALQWDNKRPAFLHVVSRDPKVGHVVSLPVDPFFTFHTGNAWDSVDEHGNTVIEMDCCAFPNGNFLYQIHRLGLLNRNDKEDIASDQIKPFTMNGMQYAPGHMKFGDLNRYKVTWNSEQKTGEASVRKIAENIEFPRFHPNNTYRSYKYLWGCQVQNASAEDSERFSLVKVDLETGKTLTLDKKSHMYTEPVFVPRPGAEKEDDGALLVFTNVLDPKNPEKDRCVLSVVDAQTMQEVARSDIGEFPATTFHGSYVDSDFTNISIS
ncbi:putative carotene-dioxygenase [Phascolomyces articulosus]|uniref:Carotene-dioxygenase n=1 Tax=Phascolomyces articulosus TaxID=60185 RepID=A0AAD5K0G5_9FUNG|nr:putative carotene-dioxygenase [Phascolomyces articulosus]